MTTENIARDGTHTVTCHVAGLDEKDTASF